MIGVRVGLPVAVVVMGVIPGRQVAIVGMIIDPPATLAPLLGAIRCS